MISFLVSSQVVDDQNVSNDKARDIPLYILCALAHSRHDALLSLLNKAIVKYRLRSPLASRNFLAPGIGTFKLHRRHPFDFNQALQRVHTLTQEVEIFRP